jgi:hypothetical protein
MQVFVPGYRTRNVLMTAAFPAVMLVVCPVMDAPFYAAKFTVLLTFGAVACLLLPKALPVSEAVHTNKVDRERHRVSLFCFGAWALSACIATTYAHVWETAWRPLAEYGSAIAVATAMIRLRIERQAILFWMAISSSVLACAVLAGWAGYDLPRLLTGTAASGRMRTAASLGNPLFVASFLSAAMWCVCALRGLRLVWQAGLLLLMLLALAATGERTAIAGVVAGAVCWLASAQHKPRHAKFHVALVFFTVAGLLAASHALNPRNIEVAANGRIFLWKASLHHVTLLGGGAGSFPSKYSANIRELAPNMPASNFVYVAFESQAHNLFVQQIVEEGPFGAIAFLGFLAVWFSSAWKGRSQIEVRAALAGTVAFLAAACFDNPMTRPEGALLLACWMAVPYMCSREHPSFVATHSSEQSHGWTHRLLPLCSFALLVAGSQRSLQLRDLFRRTHRTACPMVESGALATSCPNSRSSRAGCALRSGPCALRVR